MQTCFVEKEFKSLAIIEYVCLYLMMVLKGKNGEMHMSMSIHACMIKSVETSMVVKR